MNAYDIDKQIFSKNLNYYLEILDKKQIDLVNDLNLNSSTVSNWCNGLMMPRMDKIKMLASYFGINTYRLTDEHSSFEEPLHSDEFETSTILNRSYFEKILKCSLDPSLSEDEATIIREYTTDLFEKYKVLLEKLIVAKKYWDKTKDQFIELYKDRGRTLTEKEAYEMFLKLDIHEEVADMIAYVKTIPSYIADEEEVFNNKMIKKNNKKSLLLE